MKSVFRRQLCGRLLTFWASKATFTLVCVLRFFDWLSSLFPRVWGRDSLLTTGLVFGEYYTSPSSGFGTNIPVGSNLSSEIDKHLKKQFPKESPIDISHEVNKIRAFDQGTDNSTERWNRLARILDGKKILKHLCYGLVESFGIKSFNHWEEMRGCLANVIASKETIDSELIELIGFIENA